MFLWCNKMTQQKIVFITKGAGEKKRSHNIEAIKQLILKGFNYQQIWQTARKYITPKTFNEYYQIAFEEVEAEKHEQKQQ